jgi:hypothetical protein
MLCGWVMRDDRGRDLVVRGMPSDRGEASQGTDGSGARLAMCFVEDPMADDGGNERFGSRRWHAGFVLCD